MPRNERLLLAPILVLLASCRSSSAPADSAKNDAAIAIASQGGEVILPKTIDAPPGIPQALRLLYGLKQQLRACYNTGLRVDPTQSGELVVSISIGGDSKVLRADVTNNAGLSASVAECVAGVFEDASFDRAGADAATVTLTVPIRFALEKADSGARDPVQWVIEMQPSTIVLKDQDKLRVVVMFTSYALEPISPHSQQLEFFVDGLPSPSLDLAFGNGAQDPSWQLLAPGKTARDERVGVHFVSAAGDHRVSVVHAGAELASTTLHVTSP